MFTDTDANRSWAGFASVYIAVFIVVVGVTTRDRPAAAPPTGDFDFGYHAIAYPTFMVGMTATATIFVSTAATSAFLPVISEMRVHPSIPPPFPHSYIQSLTFDVSRH
jgi:hypothetical protein